MKNTKIRVIQSVPQKNLYFQEYHTKTGTLPETIENGVVNIFDDVVYQHVLGFGAALTEAAAYNYAQLHVDIKKKLMKLYFDKKDGIAYNFGRTHINSCDFSLDMYTYVEKGDKTLETFSIERERKYIIPFIKDAMAVCEDELILFASPWSPPDYMKDNNSMIHGGKLLEEYKKVWALYYAKYIKAYAREGIKIAAISVQNEPIANQTWESCYYTPEDERSFIKEYLIPVLDEEGLQDLKIIIWDHNKERVYDRTRHILSDPQVNERVWAVGHHWYSGEHFDGLRLVHEQFNKPLISTEFCGSMKEKLLPLAERYGVEICENFNNYDIASCDWNILLSTNGGPFHNRTKQSIAVDGVVFDDVEGGCYAPILCDNQTGELIITPIYYYIGHFSKFIQRGAKRIATTKYTSDLHVCAFVNPDGTKVAVIINGSDINLPVNIRYHDVITGIETEAHSITTAVF